MFSVFYVSYLRNLCLLQDHENIAQNFILEVLLLSLLLEVL